MSTVERLELHTGDRMTREEFHRVYEVMPEDFKAELIGGIVYVSSPLGLRHGSAHPPLSTLFYVYQSHTPGVECGDNTTVLLGEEGEPQPDLFMRVLPEFGGQSRTTEDDYVEGAPELITEISVSRRSIDMHAKKADYARYGVLEYVVASLKERKLYWFDLLNDKELHAGADGVLRIRVFPGLWISEAALWANDGKSLLATLEQGIASPEHADFVRRLAARRSGPQQPEGG